MPNSQREAMRQQALAEIALLDTPPEREFDALARLAQHMLGTGMSAVSLLDAERQWFKARTGPLAPSTARGDALCAVVFESEAPLTVADASLDPRFAGSAIVAGEPHVRFYAGVPVRAHRAEGDPVTVGSLCVFDSTPREATAADLNALSELACLAEALIEARAVALRAAKVSEERRLALERLKRKRRQFKQAERMADIGSWRVSLADRAMEWSDGMYDIHEMERGSVPTAGTALGFFAEPDRDRFVAMLADTAETGRPFEMDADFVTAKGNRRRVRIACDRELSKGDPVALIGILQDITSRHAMEERLRHQARTDSLTQLANRAEFHRVLDERLQSARAANSELAVLLIDLDGFKGVNDALGHAAGDDVLCRIAERLRQSFQEGWFPARLGGDEFAVVVPAEIGRAALAPIVDRLLRELVVVVASAPGHIARVAGTVGIAWSRDANGDSDTLLRQADAALYEAKRTRKGTAQTYAPDGSAPTGADRRIEPARPPAFDPRV